MNSIKNSYDYFNALCLKYQEIMYDQNKIINGIDCIYFKDQFPKVYDEFMKAFTLIPNENSMNEIAKYFKVQPEYNNMCYLEKLMVDERVINKCANNMEMMTIYEKLVSSLKEAYTNMHANGLNLEYMYIFTKLFTEKLDHISEKDRKYLLNHIIYKLRYTTSLANNIFPIPSEDDIYTKYKNLLPQNKLETNEYYNILYDIIKIRTGGSVLNYQNICPLHFNNNSLDSTSINKSDIYKQISRGSNKKLLINNNKLKFQYVRNDHSNSDKYLQKKEYIVGNESDEEYINIKANEIMKKYNKNNKYDIEYIAEQLYKQFCDKYTSLPLFSIYNTKYYGKFIVNNMNCSFLYDIDNEIDKKYFDGKLSYFAAYFYYLMNKYSPNNNICTEYILSCFINKTLNQTEKGNYCLYIMFNYMYDQFKEWLKEYQSKLGFDENWNYNKDNDIIRKRVEVDSKGSKSYLMENYKKTMDINYLRMYKLQPFEEDEQITDIYGIIKCYDEAFNLLKKKFEETSSIIDGSIIVNGVEYKISKILNDIRDPDEKDITYTNNLLLNNIGFKKYLTDMMKDFTTEQSIKTYNGLILLENLKVDQYIENLTDKGIEDIFNDYSYKVINKQNNCPECIKNMYKFITEGFYDIFNEINILRQYQKIKYEKMNNKKINLKTGLTKITDLNELIEEDTSDSNYPYVLKEDLGTMADFRTGTKYIYVINNNEINSNVNCKLKANSEVYIKNIDESLVKYQFVAIQKDDETKSMTVELSAGNYFMKGSRFNEDISTKITVYKPLEIQTNTIDENRYYIIPNKYVNTELNITPLNIRNGTKIYKYLYPLTINKNENYYNLDSLIINNANSSITPIIYADELNYNANINQYLIKRGENYIYQLIDENNISKIIENYSSKKFVIMTNSYIINNSNISNKIYNISNTSIFKIGENVIFNNDMTVKDQTYKVNTNFMLTNSKKYDYNNVNIFRTTIDKPVTYNGETISNDYGYILITNTTPDDKLPTKIYAIIITDMDLFKKYIEMTKIASAIEFDYNFDYSLTSKSINYKQLPLDETYIILNIDKIEYKEKSGETIDKKEIIGEPLDGDLIYYDWDSPLSNVNITDDKYVINNVNVDKDYIIKDAMKMDLESSKLQKEFSVKDFNKLMLRKCFPDNFKRTLVCNQDVLDAIDGSEYAIPDIKIKEALCEYGKFPLYLEHYFMSSKIDYKLKGKFNLRCIANLSKIPDVVRYLDRDELEYINKEVLVQGDDMIIKDGKIISGGDVYLVGIEINNDHMFRVPPTKILNKTLLNVIDFQQFDNIYDRIELVLDDKDITDYIVKPLTLETIGTLKDMKYINFY